MKKISLLIFLVIFPALLSIGQNIKHVSLSFNINDFKIQQDNDGNSIILSDNHNTCYKSDTSLPALPYIGYNVLVQNTEKYISHVCSSSKTLMKSNIDIAHNPEALSTNILPTLKEESITNFYSQKKYPDKDVEFVGNNDCGEYRLLTFLVCPFEFDVTTRKLYLKNQIEFDINLNSSSISQSFVGRVRAAGIKDVIKRMVVNPEDLDNQDMTTREMSSNNELTHQTGFEYVIVTSNQFKNVFQQLANWKNRKGIRSKVITVEDILPIYTGSSKQEKIKRAIADINGLSYVLLGGDTLNVPTCMCYIGYRKNTDSITPADVYYSCLETKNWNNNGNNFYGEYNDSVSLVPYLNVSRAPVSTVEDAQVFVNRIINYESTPDTVNWKDNILMSGRTLGYRDASNVWHPYYVNGISDSQIWSQMIYNQYIKPSNSSLPKWNGQLTRLYDTYADHSGDDTYDFNATNLQNELTKGYTFVDVMTHGSKTSWSMEGTQYYYYHARNLENSGYTIITTTACLTNAFDYSSAYSKCLSQEFVNNTQSGILSYWGTSRENWYYPKTTSSLGLGSVFDALTYRKLLEDKYHRMGIATIEVKRAKMSSALSPDYPPNRKIWMGLNLMGDPEMPVYLSKPVFFQNVDIQFVNDSIYVETGVCDFDICFVNQSDSTDYYITRDIETSNTVFSRKNGGFDVCVTKPNYVPFFMVCDNTYLQNKTLTGSKSYTAPNVMIGSNVTNKVAQGAVVINSGSTTIKATEGVTITKDFEVKSGAVFNVTID